MRSLIIPVAVLSAVSFGAFGSPLPTTIKTVKLSGDSPSLGGVSSPGNVVDSSLGDWNLWSRHFDRNRPRPVKRDDQDIDASLAESEHLTTSGDATLETRAAPGGAPGDDEFPVRRIRPRPGTHGKRDEADASLAESEHLTASKDATLETRAAPGGEGYFLQPRNQPRPRAHNKRDEALPGKETASTDSALETDSIGGPLTGHGGQPKVFGSGTNYGGEYYFFQPSNRPRPRPRPSPNSDITKRGEAPASTDPALEPDSIDGPLTGHGGQPENSGKVAMYGGDPFFGPRPKPRPRLHNSDITKRGEAPASTDPALETDSIGGPLTGHGGQPKNFGNGAMYGGEPFFWQRANKPRPRFHSSDDLSKRGESPPLKPDNEFYRFRPGSGRRGRTP